MKAFDIDFGRQWRDLAYTRALAKDTTMQRTARDAARLPAWWQWAAWLGCAMTCQRIERVR